MPISAALPPSAKAESIELCSARLNRARGLLHPEHHAGQDGDRGEPDRRFKQLLNLLRKFGIGRVKRDADAEAKQRGKHDAGPNLGHRRPLTDLFQIGGDNADDERGLDSLPRHDQEWHKHQR
jgi:hypothetical protein